MCCKMYAPPALALHTLHEYLQRCAGRRSVTSSHERVAAPVALLTSLSRCPWSPSASKTVEALLLNSAPPSSSPWPGSDDPVSGSGQHDIEDRPLFWVRSVSG